MRVSLPAASSLEKAELDEEEDDDEEEEEDELLATIRLTALAPNRSTGCWVLYGALC